MKFGSVPIFTVVTLSEIFSEKVLLTNVLIPQKKKIFSYAGDGTIIPKSADVIMNLYNMGRDSTLYSNPDDFQPERFELDAEKSSYFSYTPFSAGI